MCQRVVDGLQRLDEPASCFGGVGVALLDEVEEVAGVAADGVDGLGHGAEAGGEQIAGGGGGVARVEVEHGAGDEKGHGVGLGHVAVVGVGVEFGDLAAEGFVERAGAVGGGGVEVVGADDDAEGALVARQADRAEEGVGGAPGDVGAEVFGHDPGGPELDAADVENEVVGGQMGAQLGERGLGRGDGDAEDEGAGAAGEVGQVGGAVVGGDCGVGFGVGVAREPGDVGGGGEVGECAAEVAVAEDGEGSGHAGGYQVARRGIVRHAVSC